MFTKSGPIDLLNITKMLRRIQENGGRILGKYYLWKSENQQIRTFTKIVEHVCTQLFELLFFCKFENLPI